MSNSRTITIKNPSRKLEEKIREAGVQKYLWLKELCIIADRILDHLLQDGIEVVEVGLGHVGSTNVTSHRVLQQVYKAAEPQ